MNMNIQAGAMRPKLHLPLALLAPSQAKRPAPTLSGSAWRRIVAEQLG
jgi:hypothetical protein